MDNHDEDVQIGALLETLARHVSERWREELTILRAALDRQISSIEAGIDESDLKPVIQATVRNISHIAAGRVDRARQQAEATAAQTLAADRADLQRRLKDVTAAKAAAEAQYQQLVTASQKLTDALSRMQREREHVRAIAAPLPTRGESAHEKGTTKIPPLKNASSKSTPSSNPTSAGFDSSGSAPKKPLQFSGPARDAKRVKIRRAIQATVDGVPGELVDLSIGGAQVLLTQVIRPNQLVRLTLPTADGPVTCKGRIVWAIYVQPDTSLSVYRTGVKFTDVDAVAVEKFMNDFCETPLVQSRHSSGVA